MQATATGAAVLIAVGLVLQASALPPPAASGGVFGPGPLLREWRLGSIMRVCGFRIDMRLVNASGSGLVEAALASGPQRIGLAIVYGERVEAYVMVGDQNTWRRLGSISMGEEIRMQAVYHVNGTVFMDVEAGSLRFSGRLEYHGGRPNELRLVLSPITGSGAEINITLLELWRDWITYTIIPAQATATVTHTSATTVPTSVTTTTATTTRTTISATPTTLSSSYAGGTSGKTTCVSLRPEERGLGEAAMIILGVSALIIGVLAVLLHGRSRGQGP